jgi:hypothetical protein
LCPRGPAQDARNGSSRDYEADATLLARVATAVVEQVKTVYRESFRVGRDST